MNAYTHNAQYQFMIGDNLLVAPVLSETENSKKLYLPAGKWLDWWSNRVYEGNQWIFVEAPINKIPLFIKEGAVIPMQETQNFVGEKRIEELTFRIFPAEHSVYSFYEDDGKTLDYKNGEFLRKEFTIDNNSGLKISIVNKEGNYNPGIKTYVLNIFRENPVKNITVNGKNLNTIKSTEDFQKASSGYYFNEMNKSLYLKFKTEDSLEIDVK